MLAFVTAFILVPLTLIYGIWAARDVLLKRVRADERMDAVERQLETREKALNKYVETVTEKVAGFDDRLLRLEGKKAVAHVAPAQGHRR
jgi:hypothetical protein